MEKGDPLPEIHEWYPHIKKPDAIRAGTVEDVKIAHLLLFTPFTVTYTSLNDRNRMIGIVINRNIIFLLSNIYPKAIT